MKRILFVNSSDKLCGVYQYGWRLASAIAKSPPLCFDYIEVSSADDFYFLYSGQNVIIFNFIAAGRAAAPLGWLSQEKINHLRRGGALVGTIGHLRHVRYDFDFILSQNPNQNPGVAIFPLPRPLPQVNIEDRLSFRPLPTRAREEVVKIGSFGFASSTKGFPGIIELVSSQLDSAEINFNITSATYSDRNGQIRKSVIEECFAVWRPKGVSLNITENFIDDESVVRFLRGNHLNVFNYADCDDGGISSVIDFAIASYRPFGVSRSSMFSHVDDTHSIASRSLEDIMNRSTQNQHYIELWSTDALNRAFERAIYSILRSR